MSTLVGMGQLFTSFAAAVDMLAPAAATAGGGALVFLKVLKLAFATLAHSLQQRKKWLPSCEHVTTNVKVVKLLTRKVEKFCRYKGGGSVLSVATSSYHVLYI